MKYLLTLALCAISFSASAEYVSEGEQIVLDGEVIATEYVNDQYRNWKLLVKYKGRLWTCTQEISYVSCKKIGN